MVVKPAEDTPVTGGLLLAAIYEEAGLPLGLLNIVVGDEARGLRFAQRVEAGMTHINDMSPNDDPNVMFGGERNSGIGRFNSDWIIAELTTCQGRSLFGYPNRFRHVVSGAHVNPCVLARPNLDSGMTALRDLTAIGGGRFSRRDSDTSPATSSAALLACMTAR